MSTSYLVQSTEASSFGVFCKVDEEFVEPIVSNVPSYKMALLYASLMNRAYDQGRKDVMVESCWWPDLDQRLDELSEGYGNPNDF